MKLFLKPILISVFIAFTLLSAGQPIKKIRINPDYARGGTVSQIFESVTYIPLETTKESTFGSINNLQVSKHYFTFYDFDTKSIYIFDKKGKFVSKIDKAPNMPKEYIYGLSNFVLNPFDELIYLIYAYRNHDNPKRPVVIQLAVFNPAGGLNKVVKLDTTLFKSLNYSSFTFTDSHTTLFANETRHNSSQHYFTLLKEFSQVIQPLIPYSASDPFIDFAKNYQVNSRSATNSIWARNHDFDVDIMEDKQFLKYRFVFPARLSIDSAVYKDTAMMKDPMLLDTYNRKHKDVITSIGDFYKSGNLLTFLLLKGNSFNNNDVYLNSLSSGKLYSFGKISPDSTNGYFPLIQYAITGADSQYLYSFLPAYSLFEAKNKTADKHPVYSAALQRFFSTENRKSNPVIVQLKPKRNL